MVLRKTFLILLILTACTNTKSEAPELPTFFPKKTSVILMGELEKINQITGLGLSPSSITPTSYVVISHDAYLNGTIYVPSSSAYYPIGTFTLDQTLKDDKLDVSCVEDLNEALGRLDPKTHIRFFFIPTKKLVNINQVLENIECFASDMGIMSTSTLDVTFALKLKDDYLVDIYKPTITMFVSMLYAPTKSVPIFRFISEEDENPIVGQAVIPSLTIKVFSDTILARKSNLDLNEELEDKKKDR